MKLKSPYPPQTVAELWWVLDKIKAVIISDFLTAYGLFEINYKVENTPSDNIHFTVEIIESKRSCLDLEGFLSGRFGTTIAPVASVIEQQGTILAEDSLFQTFRLPTSRLKLIAEGILR